jgi:hypothetical protein
MKKSAELPRFFALVADSAEEVRVSPPNPCEFCFLEQARLALSAFNFATRCNLRVAIHIFPVDTGDSRLL